MEDFTFEIVFSCDQIVTVLRPEDVKEINLFVKIIYHALEYTFTTSRAGKFSAKEYQDLADGKRASLLFGGYVTPRNEFYSSIERYTDSVVFQEEKSGSSIKMPMVYGENLLKELARKRATFLEPEILPYVDIVPAEVFFQTSISGECFISFYCKSAKDKFVKSSICLENFVKSDIKEFQSMLDGSKYSIKVNNNYMSDGRYFYIGAHPKTKTDPRQLRFPLESCEDFLGGLIKHISASN